MGLLAFSVSTLAQVLERFSPPSGSSLLPARPTVAWSFGTENLLTNPGFEDGTNGWAVTGGTLATMIFPNSAADGTKALRILRGSVSREVTLPAAPQATTLSFALRGLPQVPDSGWLEVVDLEGTVPTRKFSVTEFVATGSWSVMTVDLSAFGGRPVRLTWTNPRADTVNQAWLLDDVRLVPVPVGAEFEVWWKSSRVAQFASLGRSPNPSRLLPGLATILRYEWRVDVHYQGSVIPGATQSFTTAHSGGAETIQEIIVPELACPGQPFPTRLRVTDERGFPAPNTPVTFSLNAQGMTANPAGVLITEVDTGSVDGVELQNLSAQPIDVSGWQVDLFRSTDTSASIKIKVPAGSTLPPGGRFTIAENRPVTSAWPALGMPGPLNWGDQPGATLTAGVVLRDESGQIRDAVFIEVQPRVINGETLPRQSGTVPQTDWRTLPLALTGVAGETYQRFGNQDHNDASDWRMAAGSFDLTNVELSSLFLPGFGTYPAQPSGLTNVRTDLEGWVQFPFTITTGADPVQVQARLRTLNSLAIKTAESPVFRVDPTTCLTLSAPAEVTEGAGTLVQAIRVTLAQPTPTNLALRLVSDQSRLLIPETFEIPAGSSEFVSDLSVANDSLLTGPVTAQLQVTAPGYSPASHSLVLNDDEVATLRWEGEATVLEGDSASASLVLDRPADAPLRIPLTSSNPSRLAVAPFVNIPAGTNRGTATWSALNNPLFGDSTTVEVEATFAGWAPARLPVSLLDNDTNTIQVSVNFNQPASEGQTVDLAISVGGASPTNLPMTITVSRPDRVQTPDYPEFPALGLGINTSLQLLDDSQVTGREEVVVEVSLPGYQTGRTTLVLLDNEPGRLSLALPVGPFAVGQEVGARLRALTIDGDPLPNADLSGTVTTLRSPNPLRFDAVAPVAVDDYRWVSVVAKEASTNARLHVEALGLSVESEPFPIWPQPTATGVRWASYDSVRDRLVVVDLAGALFALDVATGARTDFASAIPPVDVFRISHDGQFLYVAHSDLRRLARFNLATLALEADWDVGTADGTPLRVDSLATVPGQPQAVVVARRYQSPNSGPEPERLFDLAVFDGTQLRPNRVQFEVGNFLGSTVVVADDGQWVSLVERNRLQSYRLGPLGVAAEPNLRPTFLGLDLGPEAGTAVQVHDTILTLRGQQMDPLLGGEFGPGLLGFDDHLFGFDPVRDWVGWIAPEVRPKLRLLSPLSLHVLAEMPLSEALDARTFHLAPAGPGRWLWINRNRLRLIYSPSPSLEAPSDLAVTGEIVARDLSLSQAEVVFRVTHSGNQPVENVTVSLGLPYGWDQLSRPAFEMMPPTYPLDRTPLGGNRYLLGTLAPGDVREVRLRLSAIPTYALGELWVSALVGSPAPDPEPANNRTEVRVSGLLAPIPNLTLKPFQGANAELVFEFTPGFDHQYLLEHSSSLNGPWADAYGETIIGLGLPVSITLPQPVVGPNAYWRLRQIFPE